MIDKRVIPVFETIEFTGWYRLICERRSENTFEDYSKDRVIEIIHGLGYQVTFNKKENFFKYIIKSEALETQLNISLKYGVLELILGIVHNGERIKVGGPFSYIYKSLNNGERIKPATFKNYDELNTLLSESLSFFNRLNQELVKTLN